jgi:hypothetical protein
LGFSVAAQAEMTGSGVNGYQAHFDALMDGHARPTLVAFNDHKLIRGLRRGVIKYAGAQAQPEGVELSPVDVGSPLFLNGLLVDTMYSFQGQT